MAFLKPYSDRNSCKSSAVNYQAICTYLEKGLCAFTIRPHSCNPATCAAQICARQGLLARISLPRKHTVLSARHCSAKIHEESSKTQRQLVSFIQVLENNKY